MGKCKGENCEAVAGVGHSEECKKEHSSHMIKPPSCFDRAECRGRVFDNCRYVDACKDARPICGNYPLQD